MIKCAQSSARILQFPTTDDKVLNLKDMALLVQTSKYTKQWSVIEIASCTRCYDIPHRNPRICQCQGCSINASGTCTCSYHSTSIHFDVEQLFSKQSTKETHVLK